MEAVVLILDVGESVSAAMVDGDQTFLDRAVHCMDRILQRKIFKDRCRDHVGLVLLNTADADNPLADDCEDGSYEHIAVVRPLAEVDWTFVEHVRERRFPRRRADGGEGGGCDWLGALLVALDHLETASRTHKYVAKKVVLLTDFVGSAKVEAEDMDDVVAAMRSKQVELNVIGTDLGLEVDSQMSSVCDSALQVKSEHQQDMSQLKHSPGRSAAAQLVTTLNGVACSCPQAERQLRAFHSRSQTAAAWHATLQLGQQLAIPITGYCRVKKATMPSWKKTAAGGSAVRQRRTLYRGDASVPVQDTLRAYRYGSTLVPFSEEDEQQMRYVNPSPRSLQILGFTRASNVPMHLYAGDQTLEVTARRGDSAAATALSALIQALQQRGHYAIGRRTYNNGLMPRLGALMPKIRHDGECLVWVQLPFADDVRPAAFPQLPTRFSDEQLLAVDALMDSMDLTAAASERVCEQLSPDSLVNPQFQRLYQVLSARALDPEAPLPAPDDHLLSAMSPQLWSEAATSQLQRFFPLETLQPAIQQQLHLRAAGKDGLRTTLTSSSSPPPDENKKPPSSPSAAAAAVIPVDIGAIDPAGDFQKLLAARGDADFPALAERLQAAAVRLFVESFGVSLLDKFLTALRTLRDACVQRQPSSYNTWLMQQEGALRARPPFWHGVRERALGLIVTGEGPHPAVSQLEAQLFLQDRVPAACQQLHQPSQDESALLDDL